MTIWHGRLSKLYENVCNFYFGFHPRPARSPLKSQNMWPSTAHAPARPIAHGPAQPMTNTVAEIVKKADWRSKDHDLSNANPPLFTISAREIACPPPLQLVEGRHGPYRRGCRDITKCLLLYTGHHLLHQKQNQCEHLTSTMRKTLCETTIAVRGSDGRVV